MEFRDLVIIMRVIADMPDNGLTHRLVDKLQEKIGDGNTGLEKLIIEKVVEKQVPLPSRAYLYILILSSMVLIERLVSIYYGY